MDEPGRSIPFTAFASTAAAIAWHADRTPDATAIIQDGRSFTFRTVAADLAACTRDLAERRIRPGMLVGVEVQPDRYLQLLLLLGCQVLGAAVTSIMRSDLDDAADPVLRDCQALLLGTPHAGRYATVASVVPADGWHRSAAITPTPGMLGRLRQEPDPDRLALISRTSGTTGRRKAIPVDGRTLQRIISSGIAGMPDGTRAGIRYLCLYNSGMRAAWTRCLRALQSGGTVIFTNEQQAPQLLDAGLATLVLLLVGDAERIVQAVTAPPRQTGPVVEFVGSRVPQAVRQLVSDRIGGRVAVRYGANETNGIAAIGDDGIGTIRPGVSVVIVDDAGNPVPPGVTGRIRVRTETMAQRYYNDPEQSRAAFIDGWYNTNDLGYVPAPGRLIVLGRADEMLNIGGVKVPPHPLEDQIRRLDGVRDVAVLATNDGTGADCLVAAVELTTADGQDTVVPAVTDILRRHVRRCAVLALPSLPRTASGKIRRQEIAAVIRRTQHP